MNICGTKRSLSLIAASAAITLAAATTSLSALDSHMFRCEQQANGAGASPAVSRSPLEAVRQDCPQLGQIIEKFALQDLGEAFPSESSDFHPREIATVAASAAMGDTAATRRYAKAALTAGATTVEFEEMLYLTAVYAGIPKAVKAMRAISDLLISPSQDSCPDQSVRVEPGQC